MRYVALAAGYDGTLARDGSCEQRCVVALQALAATGRKLILATGRELRELLEIFPEARLFDYIVAENGAVMYRPATRQSAILAQAPSETLLQELKRRAIDPLWVGSSNIATTANNFAEVSGALQKLELDLQLVRNREVVSVLPAGIDKASGVSAALKELGISPHNLAAIGDGENDAPLLKLAEFSVAVSDAACNLRKLADRTMRAANCAGFLEFAGQLVSTDLAAERRRQQIMIGLGGSTSVAVTPGRDSLLVIEPPQRCAPPLSEHLLHQLLELEYQCCIIAATTSLRSIHNIVQFGDRMEPPRLTDILEALEDPVASVSISLGALPFETRAIFTEALLLQLEGLHHRVGRPHCIFIEEVDVLLSPEAVHSASRLSEASIVYSTVDPAAVPRPIFESVKLIADARPAGASRPHIGGQQVYVTIAGEPGSRVSDVSSASCASSAAVSG